MKAVSGKPKVCIASPGVHYTPQLPRVLNTLPMIPYLQQDFDITLVFRKLLPGYFLEYQHLSILDLDNLSPEEQRNRDGYFAPSNAISLHRYRQVLNRFAKEHHHRFDVLIEKEWTLLGALSESFRPYQIPKIIVIEGEYNYKNEISQIWQGNPLRGFARVLAGIGFQHLRTHLKKQWIREVDGIIAETDQMQAFLMANGYLYEGTPVHSIPNGIDPKIFFPRDRTHCRSQLGIPNNQFVLTYVGSLNRFIQEPAPILEALGREKPKNTILHVVGDGKKQTELEAIAQKFDAPVIFHGRMSQDQASLYIGAANLCIAPYNKAIFTNGFLTVSSLKVPEYLACGRPVLTTPCERTQYLLDGGRYGILLENEVETYRQFFRNLPPSKTFLEIEETIIRDLRSSELAHKNIVLTWQDIANRYKVAIWQALAKNYFFSVAG